MNSKPTPIDGVTSRGGRPSLDSFSRETLRRPRNRSPKLDAVRLANASFVQNPRPQQVQQLMPSRPVLSEDLHKAEDHFDINFEDLADIEKQEITDSQKRPWWRRKKKAAMVARHKRSKKKIVKRALLFSGFGCMALAGFLGFRALMAANSIIDRSGNCPVALCGNKDQTKLLGEGDGRINIMLVGIGGENHEGGDLADTIIVASIDPIAKDAAMLSIPRDLYLEIPGYGSSRVNAAHVYGEQDGYKKEGKFDNGVGLLQETLENALDIPIHYYLRVDFTAFKEAVDTVGGVQVSPEEALYDPTFWWQYGILDLQPGQQTLDGKTALMYVRSRKTSARGDFDRSERQQEVILSLKDKVLSAGTYSDPLKINGLLQNFGSNVRTNIQIPEMLRLYEISKEIPSDKVITTSLVEENGNYLASTSIGGASVLVPAAGDFSEIQKYVRSIFVDGFIRSENAGIAVLNGTEGVGVATPKAEELESFGYNVVNIADAPTSDYTQTVIYDVSDGKKEFTKSLLENRFKLKMKPGGELSAGINKQGVDFIIIVGDN